jgi:RHS repeat-associated protein
MMVRGRMSVRGARRRVALSGVAIVAAVATLTGTGGVAAALQPVTPSAGGPTRSAMHPSFPKPMPAPHSGLGVYTPPTSSPAKPVSKNASNGSVRPQPTEGWTTFSHWTRASSGRVTERIYPEPEFRQTSSGWQPIDASVHADDHGKAAGAEGMIRPVRFGGSANDLFELDLDGGAVTLSDSGLSPSGTHVRGDGVDYTGVATDTTLSYSVNPHAINETITLASGSAPRSYTFHLSDPHHQLGSLVDNHDGSYSFTGLIDGDVKISLEPAYAYQPPEPGLAPALVRGSAHQSVIASGDGFDITESIDSHWLAGKTFPIVLDPTVSFTDSNGTMYAGETYTSGDSRDTCYGGVCGIDSTNSDLAVGSYDLGPANEPTAPYQIVDERDLLQFNLSSIPPGSNISAATMNMYTVGCLGEPNGTSSSNYQCSTNWTTPSDAYTTALDQVTQSWDPNTLTWNGLNGIYGSAIASNYTPPFTVTNPCNGTCFWMTWNVLSEVQGWFNGSIPNYGFMARNVDENYWIAGPAWSYLGIYGSGGYGNPHPYLSVTYDPAPGAPSNVSASPGNGEATVSWGAASTNGGSAISSYKIQTYQNGTYTGQTTTACGTCTSATVSGLTNGLAYSFNVYATDADGLSGPAVMSNTVTPQAAPSISKSVINLTNPGSTIASVGQTLQYTITVTNSQSGPMTINLQDSLPASPAGSTALLGSTQPNVVLGGYLSGYCTPGSTPTCTNPTGHLLAISGINLPAGQHATFQYDAVAVGSGTGCLSVSNSATATNTNAGGSSASWTVSTPVCDNGLGMEPWWSYLTKTLGSGQTASVNAADGNLVVQATDSSEITGHGHLGFVLRRTYNSEDTTLASLPGSLGRGWIFNVAQADDLATAGVTSTGLYVPSGEQVASPLAVTMIDRDGTRLVFTPRATSTGSSVINALPTQGLTGSLATLIPKVLSAASGDIVCVDQTYNSPAGVHLALWRYIQVPGSSCTGSAGTSVIGYAAVRTDRLRYEFNATGQLLDMTDGNGVDLRYRYSTSNPTQLSQVFQTTCDPAVQASCKAYTFTYPSSTETDVTDPAGRVTKYLFYNNTSTGAPLGLYLTQVVNPDGSAMSYTYSGVNGTAACGSSTGQLCSVSDLRGHATGFSYNSNTTVSLAPGALNKLTDRLGTATSLSYATDGTWTTATTNSEVTAYKSIDSAGRVGEIQDADTSNNLYHDTFYTWDTTSRSCQQGTPTGASPVDNNLCELRKTAFNDTETGKSNGIATPDEDTTYLYNPEGQLVDQRQQTGSAALDTTYGYAAQYVTPSGTSTYADTVAGSGNVTSAARPSGTTAAQTLYVISDRNQSLPPSGNAAGSGFSVYLTSYKIENNPSVNPNATSANNPCSENNRGKSFSPSGNSGDLCETDAPDYDGTHQTITSYTYDTAGEKTSMTDPNGGTYTYSYYADSSAGVPVTDISGHTAAGGWLATVTDPNSQFVAYGYDAAGDIAYVWDRNATARNGLPASAYPGTANATSCGSSLPGGYSTTKYGPYAGSSASWCSTPWRYKLAEIDPLGNTTTYTVDANGNQLAVTSPRGNTTTQTFNNADELLTRLLPAEQQSGASTKYGYDAYGNKVSLTDPNGNVTVYKYDLANRLVETDFTRGAWSSTLCTDPTLCRESTSSDAPIPAGRILYWTVQSYDGVDNLTGSQDANHQTTTKHYDGVHRLTEVDAPTNSSGGSTLKTGYIYNPDGKTTDTCNPREYTDGGQTSCVASPAYGTHMAYDALDRMTTKTVSRATGVTETTGYTYDADGNQLSVTDPNGHATTYAYDTLDRKTSMTVPRDGTNGYTTFWTYDPSGDVTSETQPGSLNLGSGANGPLVIDGTVATSSTNRSCPQSNPCVFPTDFTTAAQGGNYTTVTLQNSAWVTVASYNGSSGGALTWEATGALSICATCGITVDGKGPGGGAGGTSISGSASNGSGDGPGHGGGNNATTGGGGGGAGHANGGAAGVQHLSTDGAGGTGGQPYGSLAGAGQTGLAAMGSGGGGGGDGGTTHGAAGGAGGGAVRLSAQSIDDEGVITAGGAGGATVSGLVGGGGGGGGSGGSVWLTSPSVTLATTNSLQVSGGPGGGGAGSDNGGGGSVGLVRFDTNNLSGTGATGNTSWNQSNAVITPLGRVTAYSYDNDNRLVDTVIGADSTTAAAAGTDGDGTKNVRTRNFYDQDGNLVAQLLPGAFATSVSSPNDDYLTRTDYDPDGRPSTKYEPRYDPAHPEPGLSSTQATQCPSPPRVTPANITGVPNYPSGVGVCITQTSYDADGNHTKVVLPTSNGSDNRYVTYTYTDDNLLASVNAPNPASNGTLQVAVAYLYDGDGKQVKQTLVPNDTTNTQSTTTSYYPNESVQQTAGQAYTPSGSTTQITHVTTYTYNADGQTLTVTDPNGNVITTTYTNDDLTATVTDGAGDETTYSYDGDGNPTTISPPSATAKDATNPSGTPTTYTYTYDNLPLSVTQPVTGNGATLRRTAYSYDQGGRKTSQTINEVNSSGTVTAAGGTQSFTYFNDDRLAGQTGRSNEQIGYSYDPAGNPTSITDNTSGVTITASYYLDELPLATNDGARCSQYTYDGLGQPVARADATYTSGACSSTSRYTTTYTYGDAENLATTTSAAAAGKTTTYSYDDLARPTGENIPNVLTVTRVFNADSTLQTQTQSASSGTVASYGYSYNNNYDITTQTFTGKAATGGTLNTNNLAYGYDAANRITSFTNGTANSITYDHDGNRLTYGPNNSFTYNADDSINTATDSNGTHPFAYNPLGDQTGDACYTYTYDGLDRLTGATSKTATGCPTTPTSATYTYDGLDRQHADNTATANTTLRYDGLTNNVSEETNTTTNVDTIYQLLPDGAKTALTQEGLVATTQYLTSDGNTNIATVTDTSGNPACTVRYDPYGDPLNPQSATNPCDTGSTLDNYYYQDARRDPTTGQYQFGARTYDPTKASYLTPDTYRANQPQADQAIHTDPLTQNTYTYVNGNPLNFNDPTGHCLQAAPGDAPVNCAGKPVAHSTAQQQPNAIALILAGWLPTSMLPPAAFAPLSPPTEVHNHSSILGTIAHIAAAAAPLALTTIGELTCVDPADGVCELDTSAELSELGITGAEAATEIAADTSEVIAADTQSSIDEIITEDLGSHPPAPSTLEAPESAGSPENPIDRPPSASPRVGNGAESGSQFQGGRYGDLETGNGIELHHMPADSVSPLSRSEGPAIQMEQVDHYQTASWGRSASAQAYRAQQQDLIEAGRFDDAIQMDIDNVTSLFPGKYDDAILQMIDTLPVELPPIELP